MMVEGEIWIEMESNCADKKKISKMLHFKRLLVENTSGNEK